MFKFAILLTVRYTISTNDQLKIYDDAFKNYLQVKVLDGYVFATLKVNVFYISVCFNMVSFRVQKKPWATLRLVSFRDLI